MRCVALRCGAQPAPYGTTHRRAAPHGALRRRRTTQQFNATFPVWIRWRAAPHPMWMEFKPLLKSYGNGDKWSVDLLAEFSLDYFYKKADAIVEAVVLVDATLRVTAVLPILRWKTTNWLNAKKQTNRRKTIVSAVNKYQLLSIGPTTYVNEGEVFSMSKPSARR